MVSDRPIAIHRDNDGRLHNPDGLAIEWRDGWGLHMIHGVKFTIEQHAKAKTATVTELIAWEDVEQRAALLRDRPLEQLIAACGKLIHDTSELGGYKIWELPIDNGRSARALTYPAWSGSKNYAKFVPPESIDCLATVAAMRGITVDELKKARKS